MKSVIAHCICKECGRSFEEAKDRKNRSDEWKEWAEGHYTVCPDCYRRHQDEDIWQIYKDQIRMGFSLFSPAPRWLLEKAIINRQDFITFCFDNFDRLGDAAYQTFLQELSGTSEPSLPLVKLIKNSGNSQWWRRQYNPKTTLRKFEKELEGNPGNL